MNTKYCCYAGGRLSSQGAPHPGVYIHSIHSINEVILPCRDTLRECHSLRAFSSHAPVQNREATTDCAARSSSSHELWLLLRPTRPPSLRPSLPPPKVGLIRCSSMLTICVHLSKPSHRHAPPACCMDGEFGPNVDPGTWSGIGCCVHPPSTHDPAVGQAGPQHCLIMVLSDRLICWVGHWPGRRLCD